MHLLCILQLCILNCYLVLRQIWLRVLDVDRPPRDLSKFLQFSDGLFADAYPLDEKILQEFVNVKSLNDSAREKFSC